MTAVLPEPLASVPASPRLAHRDDSGPWAILWRWFKPFTAHRWLQTPLLLGIAACLFYDRYLLCDKYLFKYTDEDQAIMWGAAHDLLQGKIHEPCFFGQDYNSCLEGFLAAPLVAMHLPYNVAVPTATVFLALLPFLVMAFIAWWRGNSLMSAACLLVPLILPIRYAMMTGLPRGFVTGAALAIFPAALLLPPMPRPRHHGSSSKTKVTPAGPLPRLTEGASPLSTIIYGAVFTLVSLFLILRYAVPLVPMEDDQYRATIYFLATLLVVGSCGTGILAKLADRQKPVFHTRTWPKTRYFFAAALSVIAFQVNQSCAILLVPLAVYAVMTSFREWKFWIFGGAGLLAAAPYPIYVYQFYRIYHDDYRDYLRGAAIDDDRPFTQHMTMDNFDYFYNTYVAPKNGPSWILQDFVPMHITSTHAFYFLACAFAAVTLLLVLRQRIAGVTAAFAGIVFIFISFSHDRIEDIRGDDITYPAARFFFAIPVLFVWLLFLVNASPWRRFSNSSVARWATRGALVGLMFVAYHALQERESTMPSVIAQEISNSTVCRPVPIDQVYAMAYAVDKAAKANNADLVVVSGENTWAYILPAVTTCETLYNSTRERRTWRIIEENLPNRHSHILLIGSSYNGTLVGGGPVTVDSDGYVVDTDSTKPATTGPAQPPGAGQLPQQGRGGRGGGRGGGGGRGTLFGGQMPTAGSTSTHTVQTPQIFMLPTNGRSVLNLISFGNVVFTPPKTAENPNPIPTVQREPWGGGGFGGRGGGRGGGGPAGPGGPGGGGPGGPGPGGRGP